MEDDIRAKFPSTANTRIICRSGNPLDLDDLAVVDPHSARSIVVLAPETENPDIHVIKSVLAITNNPDRKKEPYHIVAEIRDAAESRSRRAGRRQGSHLRAGRGPHRARDRADLPAVRAFGGLHRTTGFRRRRDLFQGRARARGTHVSRGDFGVRRFDGDGPDAWQGRRGADQSAHGYRVQQRRPGDRDHRGRRHARPVEEFRRRAPRCAAPCRIANACLQPRSAS